MAMNRSTRLKTGPLLLVVGIVAVQLLAAWVLDYAADLSVSLLLAAIAITLAIGLNLLRFLLWGVAHRNYPLSHIYPLTALFFPCILALSWWQGEGLGAAQLLGTALITIGAVVMSTGVTQGAVDND